MSRIKSWIGGSAKALAIAVITLAAGGAWATEYMTSWSEDFESEDTYSDNIVNGYYASDSKGEKTAGNLNATISCASARVLYGDGGSSRYASALASGTSKNSDKISLASHRAMTDRRNP